MEIQPPAHHEVGFEHPRAVVVVRRRNGHGDAERGQARHHLEERRADAVRAREGLGFQARRLLAAVNLAHAAHAELVGSGEGLGFAHQREERLGQVAGGLSDEPRACLLQRVLCTVMRNGKGNR